MEDIESDVFILIWESVGLGIRNWISKKSDATMWV